MRANLFGVRPGRTHGAVSGGSRIRASKIIVAYRPFIRKPLKEP